MFILFFFRLSQPFSAPWLATQHHLSYLHLDSMFLLMFLSLFSDSILLREASSVCNVVCTVGVEMMDRLATPPHTRQSSHETSLKCCQTLRSHSFTYSHFFHPSQVFCNYLFGKISPLEAMLISNLQCSHLCCIQFFFVWAMYWLMMCDVLVWYCGLFSISDVRLLSFRTSLSLSVIKSRSQ